MSDARHAKQPQTQPDNQSMGEKKKKKSKGWFSHQPASGSVKTQQQRKWSSDERSDRPGKWLDRRYKNRRRRVELSCHCNAIH